MFNENAFRGHDWLRPGAAASQAVSKGSRGEAPAIAFQKICHFAQFVAKARRKKTTEPASCDCTEMKLGAPCERAMFCNARAKAPATVGHRSFRAKLQALVVSFNSKRMDYQNLLRASSKSDSDCSAVRTRCLNPIQDQAQAPAQMRDPFQTLNQMRTHARPVFELGTHAVAEKLNAVVRIFGFGADFWSHFWVRFWYQKVGLRIGFK